MASPAWCRPELKGTAPGAGTGSAGCSRNAEGSPSEGVTVAPVAAGCAAVLLGAVATGGGRTLSPA